MAKDKKVYTLTLDDAELNAQLAAESERRQISRVALIKELLTESLSVGRRTQYLRDERDKLRLRLAASEEINAGLEKDLEIVKTRNKEIAEIRDSAIKQRDKFKQKHEQAVSTNEKLIESVRDAQDGSIFSRGAKVKQINLTSLLLKTEEEDDEKTAE